MFQTQSFVFLLLFCVSAVTSKGILQNLETEGNLSDLAKDNLEDPEFELDPYIPISDFPVVRKKRDTYSSMETYPEDPFRPNQPTFLGKLFFEKIKKVAKVIDKKAKFFMKKFPGSGTTVLEENPFTGGYYPWATPSDSYTYYQTSSDYDSHYTRHPEMVRTYTGTRVHPSTDVNTLPSYTSHSKASGHMNQKSTQSYNAPESLKSHTYISKQPSVSQSSTSVQSKSNVNAKHADSLPSPSISSKIQYSSDSGSSVDPNPISKVSSSVETAPTTESPSIEQTTLPITEASTTISKLPEVVTKSVPVNKDKMLASENLIGHESARLGDTIMAEQNLLEANVDDIKKAISQESDPGVILWPQDLKKLVGSKPLNMAVMKDEGVSMEDMINTIFDTEDINKDRIVEAPAEIKPTDVTDQSKPPMKFFPISNDENELKSVMEDVDTLMQIAVDTTSPVNSLNDAIGAVSNDLDQLGSSDFPNFGEQKIKMKNVVMNFKNVVEAKSSSSISNEDYMDAMEIIKHDLEEVQKDIQVIPLNKSPKVAGHSGQTSRFFEKTEFLNPKFQSDYIRPNVNEPLRVDRPRIDASNDVKGVSGLAYLVRDKNDPTKQILIPAHVIENL